MAETTANADQPAPPTPPTIVVEGPAGDGEAHEASSIPTPTVAVELPTHELPDCIIASSNRYTDLRPYCDRIWAARPEYWSEVLPWDFPRTGIKDDEETFLREHFDQTEIHMQGGAHGAGLGFRFLGQVWWSIALSNAELRAPALATAWWNQEVHMSWRKTPTMLAAIKGIDATPETFFQPAELKAHGPKFLCQAIRHIQYQLMEMEDAERLHAPRNVLDTEAKLKSTEIETSPAATDAPRADSLPSATDLETVLSHEKNAQARIANAQGGKAQKSSIKPPKGGNAGSRVNAVDHSIAHVPVEQDRIQINGKTRPISSEKASRAGKQAYYEPLHNGPALYDPEMNAFQPVQPNNLMIGRQYQQNDQNMPPMRVGSGYNAGIGAGSPHTSGGSQPISLHQMGLAGFPANQYGGYQHQNQFSQVPGGNAIYALSQQDARYYQNDVYGQQAPSVPPRYIDMATPSDFAENSSRRGGGKRHASQTSRGGGGSSRASMPRRGRGGSDRHSSYDSNFAGVRNVSMPHSDVSGSYGPLKNRRPSTSGSHDRRNGPDRSHYETSGTPGLGYDIPPTNDQSSPRIQRYNIRGASENYSMNGQPYHPQAQFIADPRTPQELLESGLLCGEKAKVDGFRITETSIGTSCRHVVDLAIFNVPTSCRDEELLTEIRTTANVTPATMTRKPSHGNKQAAMYTDHAFITLHSYLHALSILDHAGQFYLRGRALTVRVTKRYFDPRNEFFVKSQPDMYTSGSLNAYYQHVKSLENAQSTRESFVPTHNASTLSMPRKPSYAPPPVPSISEADHGLLSTVPSENTTPAPSSATTPKKSKPKKDRRANKAPREAETVTKSAEAGVPPTMEPLSAAGSKSQATTETASTAASEVIGAKNAEVKSSDAAEVGPRVITDASNNTTRQHSDTTSQSSPTAVHQPIDPYVASTDSSLAQAASTPLPVAQRALPAAATTADTAAAGTDEIATKKDVQLEDTEARKAPSAEPDTIDDSFHTAQNSPPASATRDEADLTVNPEKAVQSEGMALKETSKKSLEPTPSPTPAAVRKVSGTSKRNASSSGSVPAIPKNDAKRQKSSSTGQQKSITAQDVQREATPLKPATANEEVSNVESTEIGPVPTSTTSVPPTPSYETAPSTPALPDTQTTAADVKQSKNEARSNANMAKMGTTHDNVKEPEVEKTALVKPSAVAEKTDAVKQTADVEKIAVEKVVAEITVGEEVTAAGAVVERAAVEKAAVEKAVAAEKRKGPSQTESLSMFGKKIKPAKQKKPAKGKASIRGKPAELNVDVELANSREVAHASIASTPTLKGDDSPEQAKTTAAKETKEVQSSSSNKKGKKAIAAVAGEVKGQDVSAPSASNSPRKQSIAADLADNVGKYLGLGSFLSKGKSATNVDSGTSATSPLPTKSTNAAPVAKMVAEKPGSTITAAPQVSESGTLLQVQDFDSPSTTTKSPGQIVYTPASSPEDTTVGLGVSMAGASTSGLAATPSPAQIENIDAPPSSSKKSKKKKKSKGKGKAKDTAQVEPTVEDTDAEDEPLPRGFALNHSTDWTQLDRDVALFVTRSYSTDEGSASASAHKPSKSAGEKAREAIAARSASASGANSVLTAPHPRNLRLKRATRNESPGSASSTSSSEAARAASPPPVKQPDRARLLREQNKYLILIGADPVKLKRQQELEEAKLSIPGFGDHSRINAIDDEVAQRGPEEQRKFHDAMWAIEKPEEGSSSESMDSEDEAVARVLGEIQEKGRVLGEVSEGEEDIDDIDLSALSEKDKADLLIGVKTSVDMVFASFAARAGDITAIR
ncbi:hypothetical protein B0A48_07605 [Cryoendolithus antarcticus]|uniref:Pyruvate kinase barrel domain-containing protein n=1 Tax=Cryoendolithus antarcticus TaxID=1507870 RepID=A0A1V8T6U0_9PEZI|nr:hypothetical protein B0A48_07605 [Cryoendolithus antarcticus]